MIYPRGRRARWLAGAAVAAAAAGSAFAFIPTASGTQTAIQSAIAADSNQTTAVQAAFTAAIQADRRAQAPSAVAYGTMANAAVRAGRVAPMASAAVRSAQLLAGKAVLAKYFAPAQARHEDIGLTNAVSAEADPRFRNLGSGASKVVFDQVAVSANTATLRAEVTTWAKFQQRQPTGTWATANPVNVMVYTVTMIRNSSGKWLVSSMVGDFAPGKGP
jgi:hypothetical protein